ncbi:hypothetical protein H0H92_002408 [Tricholoma furcatifolium]|nr:hypothetical protein H0H92_002408 [Tricholoma furcatifolium]
MSLPFYDHLGVLVLMPAAPSSKTPISTIIRAASDNLTLEAAFDDGQRIIARKVLFMADPDRAKRSARKLRIESRLLAWLGNFTDMRMPIPRVLYEHPLDDDGFRSRGRLAEPDAGVVVPTLCIDVNDLEAPKVFDDVCEYIDFLIEKKRRSHYIGQGDPTGCLDELSVHIHALLRDLQSKDNARSLLRGVLSHDDLNEQNILVDEHGQVTGVVDWEYHSITPAFLAANYPPWLSYDGPLDPRFADPHSLLWLDSAEQSKSLREYYSEVR